MAKEYIERGALFKTLNKNNIPFVADVNHFIMHAPTADVVEVVRCKNCACFKRSVSDLFPKTNCFICDHPYGMKANVEENHFCSYGERKDGNG